MVTLAVIPARGGSTRVVGKNKRDLAGQPLVSWSIQAALAAESVDHVVVSSDDPDIIEIAEQAGALTLGLREQHSDDDTPSSAVTLYEAKRYAERFGSVPATLIQLLPTCPFRTSATIDKVVGIHRESGSSVISASAPLGMNLWWAVAVEDTSQPLPLFPDAKTQRSQDLPPVLVPSGAVWVSSLEALDVSGTFYSKPHRFTEIPWLEAFDIDTPEEFSLAAELARVLRD